MVRWRGLLTAACWIALACCPAQAQERGPERDYREEAWQLVEFEPMDLAVLASGPREKELARHPIAVALCALRKELECLVPGIHAEFDAADSPAKATVTVRENGFLDDDLLGRRYVVTMERREQGGWKIVRCERGECRRVHLGRAGHPLFAAPRERQLNKSR